MCTFGLYQSDYQLCSVTLTKTQKKGSKRLEVITWPPGPLWCLCGVYAALGPLWYGCPIVLRCTGATWSCCQAKKQVFKDRRGEWTQPNGLTAYATISLQGVTSSDEAGRCWWAWEEIGGGPHPFHGVGSFCPECWKVFDSFQIANVWSRMPPK